jgi:N utilization substance protein B
MSRQARLKPRTQAVRILYEILQTDHSIESVLERHMHQPIINELDDAPAAATPSPQHKVFVRTIIDVALLHRMHIDALVMEYAPNVPLADMPVLQRVVLYVAIAELHYMTPEQGRGDTSLIINAAVEITRAYVGDSAARFVNGVLGRVA